MHKLVFDIETTGEDFDSYDKDTQSALTWWLNRRMEEGSDEYDQELENIKETLGLSPLTGQVVAIGVLDVDLNKGAVYYQDPQKAKEDFDEDGITFRAMSEKEMLLNFWEGAKKYNKFISFNGRCFDVPYLMIRSAIHGLQVPINLMGYRYAQDGNHIDLLDQLTFQGAMNKKGNLHLWTRAFGIKSPKGEGITGDDVTGLFKDGKYLDIARYNVGDLRATRELFLYWDKYLRF